MPLRAASISPRFSRSSGGIQAIPSRRVDLGLVLARQHLAALDVLDAVLADLEPCAHRRLAERHVVVLGAGEVLEQVAVHLRRDHAQLDHRAVVGDGRDPVVAPRGDLGHPLLGDERLGSREPVGHRGDDVDVLPGLGEPAQAAGGLAPDDRFAAPSSVTIRSASGRRRPIDVRRTAAPSPSFSPSRIASSVFWPMPPIPRMRLRLGRLAHLVDGLEAELGEDPPGRLRADAGDAHHRRRAGRVALHELVERGDLAALRGARATLAATVSPTPGSEVSRPSAESRATDSAVSRSDFAARR